MKSFLTTLILIVLCKFCSAGLDTVKVYWPNGTLKYQSICCFVETINDPETGTSLNVLNRHVFYWDESGKEIESSLFFEQYGDIIDLKSHPVSGEDEQEYRDLILKAKKLKSQINYNDVESINAVIQAFKAANDIIPDAIYPKTIINEINKKLKN